MKESRLRLHLKEQDELLFHRFHALESELTKLLEYSQGGPNLALTPHGLSHIIRLEEAFDWLLVPDDTASFNAYEVFVLLTAAYCHDILMVPRRPGDENSAREKHAQNVAAYLSEHQQLQLSDPEARAIGHVVRGHHVDSLEDLPKEVIIGRHIVDVRKLAACLSLADICDADDRRAPRIVFDHLTLNETSRWHWQRHMQISGITRRGSEILMSAFFYSTEGEEAVNATRDSIETQLARVRPYFNTILVPIDRVTVIAERQRSPVDTPIAFKADVPAILALLIEGVYQRDDVFVRELIQNALDAGYLAQAQAFRRSGHHQARIIVSALIKDGRTLAVRVDDNGIGMSIREVKDTLLTIAATQATSQDVRALLASTGKSLIATFGIGLLSCLKVAHSVEVLTHRENEQPVELSLEGVESEVRPRLGKEDMIGSTFRVNLLAQAADVDIYESVAHYCVQVRQAMIYFAVFEDESSFRSTDRQKIFEMAENGDFELIEPEDPAAAVLACQIVGEGFDGWVTLDSNVPPASIRQCQSGEVVILNDGLLVGRQKSDDWLFPQLSFLNAIINFRAGAVSLGASRDFVRKDAKYAHIAREIAARSKDFVPYLAEKTRGRLPAHIALPGTESIYSLDQKTLNTPAFTLACIFDSLREGQEPTDWFLADIDAYTVNMVDGSQEQLGSLKASGPARIYVAYGSGNTVDELCHFNGLKLYYEPDLEVGFEAQLLRERGATVILADTFRTYPSLREANLIRTYLARHGSVLVDVFKTHPMENEIRSKGISRDARATLGSAVKFVDLPTLQHQRAWRLGDETWLNTANPDIAGIYRLLTSKSPEPAVLGMVKALVLILGARFDDAVEEVLRLIS